MTGLERFRDLLRQWRESLMHSWHIPFLDQVHNRIQTFSPGDRAIFYVLAALASISSLVGLYTLEQSLLVEVPSYGGTLVEGEVGSPRFINPLLAMSDADRDLSALVYAGLMGLSGDGTLVPVLAETYSISEDSKSYTFTLRENAKFSDGTPVTASDVIFTIHKAQDPGLKSPEYADWSGVRAETVDQRTVRFTLSKAYAPFLGLTTIGILPARLWQNMSNEEFPFSLLETTPVGAGPFKVTNVSRDASGLIKSVLLSANTSYVLGRPYLDGIRFNFYSRVEDLSTALKNGMVESAYNIPADDTLSAPYARIFGVFLNQNEKQLFARTEVRKALSLAVDRQALIDSVLDGYATAIMGPVPPGGSVKQVPVPKLEDPTEAAANVLESSGWAYDGSARAWKTPNGKQILDTVTIRTSNMPELKNVASAIKEAWENLGITVTIELYEPGDLSQNVIRPRKYEALLYGEVIGREQDLYAFWDSQEINDPGLNIALYTNKTVDALLEIARSSGDQETRTTALQKIETIIASEYPATFLYAPDFIYTVPRDLHGVALPQIIIPADRFATAAKWFKQTDKVWPFFVRANN